ncbi:hypothetical protein JCM8097_007084 [Rhodosporidiobolus ruineniae]
MPKATTASFAEAMATGAPLSSHGSKHAASIARGQACKACRRRKMKCDGVKPLCGACAKSASAHGADLTQLECEYDDVAGPKKKRAPPGSKVAALEAELAELKAMIAQGQRLPSTSTAAQAPASAAQLPLPNPVFDASMFPPPPPSATNSSSSQPSPPPFPAWNAQKPHWRPPKPTINPSPSEAVSMGPAIAPWHPPPTQSNSPRNVGSWQDRADLLCTFIDENTDGMGMQSGQSQSGSARGSQSGGAAFTPPSMGSEPSPHIQSSSANDLFRELLYPGWPRDLPSPELTMRLVEVWFSRPHLTSGMVNAAKFRTALLLPPTSPAFPHTGLLHMICSMAAMMVSEDLLLSEGRYWPPGQRATEYHASCAKAALDSSVNNGDRLFQVAQCITLLCIWAYTNARFVELWLFCGQATRILTPLGLNHLRSANDSLGVAGHFKPYLLPPTSDPEELRERAAAFYFAFLCDRMASAATGWAQSLDEADITTVIPTDIEPYPTGPLDESPLSPRSSMFFLAHPPNLCGPLQLVFKAVVLFGKVNVFTQRAPHMSFPGRDNGWGLNDPVQDIRTTDMFRRLNALVEAFRSSIPREYQVSTLHPGQANVLDQTRICLVHGLGHISTILLHEPWVSSLDEEEASMRKCLDCAKAILKEVFTLLTSSYEISLYSPYINLVWAVAGRTFVRQLAMRIAKNEVEGQVEIRSAIDTLLMALKAYKTPLGAASAAQLQFLVDDPLRTLPAPYADPNNMNACKYVALFSPQPPSFDPVPKLTPLLYSTSVPNNCPGDYAGAPQQPTPLSHPAIAVAQAAKEAQASSTWVRNAAGANGSLSSSSSGDSSYPATFFATTSSTFTSSSTTSDPPPAAGFAYHRSPGLNATIASMNAGMTEDASRAVGGTMFSGLASSTQDFLEKLPPGSHWSQGAGSGKQTGMAATLRSTAATGLTPPRIEELGAFEDLSRAEMTGLESLLGL